MAKSAENANTSAPRVRGRPFKKGHSGNPGGRPKTGAGTITGYMRLFGGMTPAELSKELPTFAKALASIGKSRETINGMIAIATALRLINDPEARLLGVWLDRTEGKLPTVVKTWRDDVTELIKAQAVGYSDVEAELGADLARELFRQAGVEVGQ